MRAFNNLSLLAKLAIPALLLVAVATGLVWMANASLGMLAQTTETIVDVKATRAVTALQMSVAVDEAAIGEKNIIIETDEQAMQKQFAGYKEYQATAMAAIDRLIAMADTPLRRTTNEAIKADLIAFFTAADRSISYGLKNQNAAAAKISNDEVRPARLKIADSVAKRVETNLADLQLAKQSAAQTAASAQTTLIATALVGLVFAVALLAIISAYGVSRPLHRMTSAMGRLADGNLQVDVAGTERKDEVGLLACALQVFKDNAITAHRLAAEQKAENAAKMRRAELLDQITKRFEHNVSALTQGLAGAATEMEATAQSMTGVADQTTQQTVIVASSAEETSANVQTVAAATEELSASVQEIVHQVTQSALIAGRAVENAARTDATVRRLAATAERITEFVSVISNIAAQTNLLRLTQPSRLPALGKQVAASPLSLPK